MTEFSDTEVDALLVALSREGFELPYMARSRDYATPEELAAADKEAWAENRAALRSALAARRGTAETGDDDE